MRQAGQYGRCRLPTASRPAGLGTGWAQAVKSAWATAHGCKQLIEACVAPALSRAANVGAGGQGLHIELGPW